MEMWLEDIMFPVTPFFRVAEPYNNHEENLDQVGTVNIAGNKGLRSASIESFFPYAGNNYTFTTGSSGDPWSLVEQIRNYRKEKKPLRFLITETSHNFLVLIENFENGEEESTGDVNYTLELKEYVELGANEYVADEEAVEGESRLGGNLEGKTPIKTDGKDYVTKETDTLWDLAQKEYGNGSRWQEIYNKNKDIIGNNPNVIEGGLVIKL